MAGSEAGHGDELPLSFAVFEGRDANPREFLCPAREVFDIALQLFESKAESNEPFLAFDRFDVGKQARHGDIERIQAWRRLALGECPSDSAQEFRGHAR